MTRVTIDVPTTAEFDGSRCSIRCPQLKHLCSHANTSIWICRYTMDKIDFEYLSDRTVSERTARCLSDFNEDDEDKC